MSWGKYAIIRPNLFFDFIDDDFSSCNTLDKRRFLIGVDVVDEVEGVVITDFSTL